MENAGWNKVRRMASVASGMMIFACAVLMGVVVMSTGCVSTPVQVRPAQTNVVEVIRTNVVSVVQTNTVVEVRQSIPYTNTVVVTNALLSLSTNVLTVISPPVYYTNLSISPIVETVATVGGQVAPGPWGAASGVALGIAGSVLAVINDRRRKKALGEATTWEQAATVLVKNVEDVRKTALKIPGYTPEVDAKVVRGLELAQYAGGVKDRISALVEEHTDYTNAGP